MKRFLRIVLPLLVVAVGVAGSSLLVKFRKQVQPRATLPLPPLVEVMVARTTNHQFLIHTQGTVEPRTQIQLTAEVAGRILSVAPGFDAGGFFEEGDVLVSMDPRDFELALVEAEARLEQAKYQLELEEATAEVARLEWQDLGEGEARALLLREPQLAQARAALAAAAAGVEQAQRDLDRSQVRAPFAGRVGTKMVDVGQFLSRGTVLARIYAVDHAEVRLPLAAEDLAYVDLPLVYRGDRTSAPGPAVRLKASLAGREHVWEGTIDRVEGEMDPRTRMLFAVARVTNPYGRGEAGRDRPPLASGMFVQAEILGRKVEEVVVLPRHALRGKSSVVVVDGENIVHERSVEVWRTGRRWVILRQGVQDGERICLTPLDAFVSGRTKVRLAEPGDAALGTGEAEAGPVAEDFR